MEKEQGPENMPEELTYTDRSCKGEINNKWGATITNVHLWHRKDLDPPQYRKEWCIPEIKKDETAILPTSIPYCTPGCEYRDYWYLVWHDEAGRLWKVNIGNFYCDFREEDQAGIAVTFTIRRTGVDVDMTSGRCWVGINQASGQLPCPE